MYETLGWQEFHIWSGIVQVIQSGMDKTFWEVVSAAAEQSRRKAKMVVQGDGKFGPWGWPQNPSRPKKSCKYGTLNATRGRAKKRKKRKISFKYLAVKSKERVQMNAICTNS